jgi:trans-aconitate 2-methyltransferase
MNEEAEAYLFADNEAAARRLELLARIFASSTAAFLHRSLAGRNPMRLIDLGCGPGFTTRLLIQAAPKGRAIGLETSPHFLELAQTLSPDAEFMGHDAMAVPFPCGPADVIFSRFLLTHLKFPQEAVMRWASQLTPGGVMLIEETAAIHTDAEPFVRYLKIVEALIASQSRHLYAGALIERIALPSSLRSDTRNRRRVRVRNCDAARMFLLNLNNWRGAEFVRRNYSGDEIKQVEIALADVASDESETSAIEWEMCQALFEKTGTI